MLRHYMYCAQHTTLTPRGLPRDNLATTPRYPRTTTTPMSPFILDIPAGRLAMGQRHAQAARRACGARGDPAYEFTAPPASQPDSGRSTVVVTREGWNSPSFKRCLLLSLLARRQVARG